MIGIWYFNAPPDYDAARVRENWFWVSLILYKHTHTSAKPNCPDERHNGVANDPRDALELATRLDRYMACKYHY